MTTAKKPMVLVILDGYGYREDKQDNAILNANTPVMDKLWAECPHSLISGSGLMSACLTVRWVTLKSATLT